MFFTYVIQSQKNYDIYVGSTEHLSNRLQRHNSEKVRSTKAYRPWKMLEFKEFSTRSEAFKYEMFLKAGQQKEILKRKYN